MWVGDDATPTNWTEDTTEALAFLIEPQAADQFLQSGGQFVNRFMCAEGSPLNQSKGLVKNLTDSDICMKGGTILIRGTGFTKDKTFFDVLYGFDHDRIVIRCNVTTGYAQVDLFETDGTQHTVTGTSDISSGYEDIGIEYRAQNDGSDYLKLFVNGVEEASKINQSFTFSDEMTFNRIGTIWLGGGFPLPQTWTEDEDMSALPSAGNWTYDDEEADSSEEGEKYSVSGGKLYQNKAGFGSTDFGQYEIAPSLSNAGKGIS